MNTPPARALRPDRLDAPARRPDRLDAPARRPPPGLVLWQGPSLLTGAPVVVVMTGTDPSRPSENPKTGPVLPVWVLPADRDPVAAAASGNDDAVCGTCPARPSAGGWCYVSAHQAPHAVWHAWRRGRYPPWHWARHSPLVRGRVVRFGAWGDPAAAPVHVWTRLAALARATVGYTHAWRTFPQLRRLCMASVDSPSEADDARAAGWRTFRSRLPDEPLGAREVVCPASPEAGHRMTCERCRACSGALDSPSAAGIAIVVHGRRARVANYERHREIGRRPLPLVP